MIQKIKYLIKKIIFYNNLKAQLRVRSVNNKTKIFCVGFNKTGTTSLNAALRELGVIMAPQRPAENLFSDWKKQNYCNILDFCKEYQGFQDIPFSLPNTYKILDSAFPKSKFILTIRDDDIQWHKSIKYFHSKLFGQNGNTPTKNDLRNANYIYKGWIWDVMKTVYNPKENDIYNNENMIKTYNNHNKSVMSYFNTNQLLIINISEPNSFQQLAEFIGVKTELKEFPWLNKT